MKGSEMDEIVQRIKSLKIVIFPQKYKYQLSLTNQRNGIM